MPLVDNQMNPVMGIDLGTTFCAIASWDGRGPRIFPGFEGNYTTQSAVFYDEKENRYLVGKRAYLRYLVEPENGIIGVKRLMDDKNHVIHLGTKVHNPVEISSKILSKLYEDVLNKFPQNTFESRGTIVTVPYYFKAHQCANTREAAEMAQINFLGLIQEPIAAALAYSLDIVRGDENNDREETVLVFDLGGGTFDLTLFKLLQTRQKLVFEVLGTGGDDRLGGLDFDCDLKQFILTKVDTSALDEKARKIAIQKIIDSANTAKEALSFGPTYNLVVPYLIGDQHLDIDITREEFESCIKKYIQKVRNIIEDTFARAGVKKKDVTRVIKVGGSSKIPIFSKILQDGIGADRVYGNIDASLCVAQGAAIYAAYLDDKKVLGREIDIITRSAHALGLETADGGFFPLIPANRKLPYEYTQIFATDQDNMTQLEVAVYQGSSKIAHENSLIGKVYAQGLEPKPKGVLNIRITFKVNEEQRVTVLVEEPVSRIRVQQALSYA
ncbi:MAG: Hsp70 family protein [Desulfomonile sp.]